MPDDHMVVTAVGLPDGATSLTFASFDLESGQVMRDVVIGYTEYGTLNEVSAKGFSFFAPPLIGALLHHTKMSGFWCAIMGARAPRDD
jgi:homoserine acetyltransferase